MLHLFIGPPDLLETTYFETNCSVCFYAYSHPEYPVQYISVSVTVINYDSNTVHAYVVNQTLHSNSSCLPLISDVCNNSAESCKALLFSGDAINDLGNSAVKNEEIVITGKNFRKVPR